MFKAFYLILFLCCFGQSLVHASTELSANNKVEQFITLADLHFDPFISCDSKPCPLIKKLQQAPASEWLNIFSEQDTSSLEYGEDSNYFLLESSLGAAKHEADKLNPQFILIIGDLLAHNFDKKYQSYARDKTKAGYADFVKKTMTFLTAELNRTFPHTDVYFAVGNNDSYSVDYSSDTNGKFFKDMGELNASLIKNKTNKTQLLKTFYHGGYYAVNAPHQPQLRLIILNSVLFSTKAVGPKVRQTAEDELAWLHKELVAAAKNKQRALIAMHIPTGIDVYTSLFNPFRIIEFWKSSYSDRFLIEIQEASPQIMGVFPAHIHADSFQILTTAKGSSIPFTGTPSISPLFGNNPAFKIYSYSVPSLNLIDFATYYYSLNNKKEWEKEYDFDQVYQLTHNHHEIINGMKQLEPTGRLADYYKTYYSVNNNSQPITKHDKWLPYYWCAIRGITKDEYQDCLHSF